jgi:hypothetical protein
MPPTDKPKVRVRLYYQFAEQPGVGRVRQFTLAQVKKYASAKPLRRPAPLATR